MVVNRKQPTAPQPVSRSSSTQHVPTKRHLPIKGTTTTKLNGSGPESPLSKSTSHKSKKTHSKKRRPKTLLDKLFPWSLLLFVFYAFYSCRPNPVFSTPLHNLAVDPNPVCRVLDGYRVHILEPYVVPAVKHTLALTYDIAEPYITSVKHKTEPFVAPAVKATKTVAPYVTRAFRTTKAIWNKYLVPFYKDTIVRYYRIAVLPRYRLYVKPRLSPIVAAVSIAYDKHVSIPLHIQATYLNRVLRARTQPYIKLVQPYVKQAYSIVHEATVQAIKLFNTHVLPRFVALWKIIRPHLCTALKLSKAVSVKTAEIAAEKGKIVTREAGVYRRAYVDPHIRKIWDKVAEGTPSASESITTPTSITEPPVAEDARGSDTEPVESTIQSTHTTAAEELHPTPIVVTEQPIVEESEIISSIAPTPEEAVDTRVPVESATYAPSSSIAQETSVYDQPAEVLSEAPDPEIIPEPTPVESVEGATDSPTPTPEEPTPAASLAKKVAESVIVASFAGSTGSEDLDLDGFLADLGIDTTENAGSHNDDSSPSSSAQASPPKASLTEEERLAKITAKRNEIVDRHEQWFADLDDLIANETVKLVDVLDEWRTAKAAELASMAAGNGTDLPLIEEVQVSGQRLLKGLEGYLKNAESRSAAWKLPPGSLESVPKEEREKKTALAKSETQKWSKVLEKVEAKFAETVVSLRAKVHAWFVAEREYEVQAVLASTAIVKQFAERAQADLGLPYAWLEDVTYADWQQYHELMNMHDRYDVTARCLQNGTELPEPVPLPPTDPIVPALDVLHNELENVILGFNVALGPVRSSAIRLFNPRTFSDDSEDDDDSGFFVVRDGEVRRDDLRDVDFGSLGIEKKDGAGSVKVKQDPEEVKILPIGPGDGAEAVDPATIFVGKYKVQVEQALGGVPLEPAAARHDEL